MLSGPQALAALDDALRDIRREEDEVTRRIARTTDRVGKLRETELGQVAALVRAHREGGTEQADEGLARTQFRAGEMFAAHAKAMDALEVELAEKDRILASFSASRAKALENLAARRNEIDALAETINAALADDPLYQAARCEAARLDREALMARERARLAEADHAHALRAFDRDPLFSYLWAKEAGEGTRKVNRIVRALDAMVARHIGFEDAREIVTAHRNLARSWHRRADRLAGEADTKRAEWSGRLDAAINAAGGGDARAAIAVLEAEIVRLDAETVLAEDSRERLTQQHKELADGGDPTFEDAVGVLRDALAVPEVGQLLEKARRSESAEDEAALARIADTRRRIAEDEAELGEQRARLKTLETRRRELEDIVFEFKRVRFDDPDSVFATGRLAAETLSAFLIGSVPADQYWRGWQAEHGWSENARRRPGWIEPALSHSESGPRPFSRPR